MLVLLARAEARAILYAAGEYQCIEDAIAPLLDYAYDSGVLDNLGEEEVCAIVKTAFGLEER
jgi:hypothetical protein